MAGDPRLDDIQMLVKVGMLVGAFDPALASARLLSAAVLLATRIGLPVEDLVEAVTKLHASYAKPSKEVARA